MVKTKTNIELRHSFSADKNMVKNSTKHKHMETAQRESTGLYTLTKGKLMRHRCRELANHRRQGVVDTGGWRLIIRENKFEQKQKLEKLEIKFNKK